MIQRGSLLGLLTAGLVLAVAGGHRAFAQERAVTIPEKQRAMHEVLRGSLEGAVARIDRLDLDVSYQKFLRAGKIANLHDLELAIHDGAVKRIRPKTMTVMALLLGLIPIMIGAETGADTMKRLAAPMIGGLVTSFIMELLIYPVIFYFYKRWEVRRMMRRGELPEAISG